VVNSVDASKADRMDCVYIALSNTEYDKTVI